MTRGMFTNQTGSCDAASIFATVVLGDVGQQLRFNAFPVMHLDFSFHTGQGTSP
jgi:hypothetical protein